MSSSLSASVRLFLFVCAVLVVVPVMLVLNALRHPLREDVARLFHATCCRAMGIKVEVRGTVSARRPTLFACNHISYLDIIVIGGLAKGCFVAKQEIATWPVFGFLAGLQRTIYIERRRRHAAGQRNALNERLTENDNIILFPEGTSSDGNLTKPFKSALFSVAKFETEGAQILVQPVSIAYTRLDGIPLGRHLRPLISWYGDMELISHAWKMIGLGRLLVEVEFHEPVTLAQFGSRKALAEYCQEIVAAGMARAIFGRDAPSPANSAVTFPAQEAAAE